MGETVNEDEIQRQCIQWMVKNKKYREKHSDPNGGAGARMDSVGLMRRRPTLIEFKAKIVPSIIRYSGRSASSIERKIRNTLEELYSGALLKSADMRAVPKVYVIAGDIPDKGCLALEMLLQERSVQWRFQYEIGLWAEGAYRALSVGPREPLPAADWCTVVLPDMPWPGQRRRPSLTVMEQRQLADQRGVRPLFDAMLDGAHAAGLSVRCFRANLQLRGRVGGVGRHVPVCTIWPGDSGKQGLCVGTSFQGAAKVFSATIDAGQLPGTAAPTAGYLDERRFLKSPDHVAQYWAALGSRSSRV